jgi:apolipoprotein N-acyltransferase
LLAGLAGVALSLSAPPVGFFWVLPAAVAAYVVITAGMTPRRAWVPGLAFGVGYCYVLMWWMREVDVYAWVALSGLEALFYGLLGAAVPVLRRLPVWPLWVAMAWTAMEVLRSGWPFSGMPWGRLAFAVVDTPVAPALAYVGATGVSLLLALVGAWLAALVLGDIRRLVAGAALAATAALLLAPALQPWEPSPDGSVRVASVQGDVPGDGTEVLEDFRQVTENHVQATVDLASEVEAGERPRPDFVLWPENSTAVDPFADAQTRTGIEAAAAAIGVPILVGAMVDAGPDHVMNQGIVWDPVLGAGDRYTKRHPVPFGEYIPWRNVFGDSFGKLDMIPRDMLSGTREEPLRVGGALVADAICFDVAYDDGLYDQVDHGAQLVVVQTSNAMFIHTAQIEQQFEISRVRALELGRALVVASVNGRTGIIGPDGAVIDSAEPRTTAVIDAEVTLDSSITPGTRAGHWIGRLAGPVTVLALAAAWLGYPRRRERGTPAHVLEPPDHTDRDLASAAR